MVRRSCIVYQQQETDAVVVDVHYKWLDVAVVTSATSSILPLKD